MFEVKTKKLGLRLDERIMDTKPLLKSMKFIVVTEKGNLYTLDTVSDSIEQICSVQCPEINFEERVTLAVSVQEEFISVVNTYGKNGVIVDISQKKILRTFERDDYHFEQSIFPAVFLEDNNRTLFVQGTKWNRLDITDVRTGESVVPRPYPYCGTDEDDPSEAEHRLDYFHGQLLVSPGGDWIADNGWIWHPTGSVTAWNVQKWVNENVWESEDGESRTTLWWGKYDWNEPICWMGETKIGIIGRYDPDLLAEEEETPLSEDFLIRVMDVRDGKESLSFKIAFGDLYYDDYLYCTSAENGFRIYDSGTGKDLYANSDLSASAYHPEIRQFLSLIDREITVFTVTERRPE
ncbi:hypothetical protein ACFVVQ_11995 [Paenibacillus chitinolyticus]|uniref:hypothetical protein n=1 Tax=Paenibacillus chitinolyticus TaxID=79263 RepID=UPI0036DA86CC